MRKLHKIHGLDYTTFMQVIESENKIRISVYKGSYYDYNHNTSDALYKYDLRKSKVLELIGLPLEKRTTITMRRLIRKMNKHAEKHANKHAKLYKAYEETKDIFTLDDHMGV